MKKKSFALALQVLIIYSEKKGYEINSTIFEDLNDANKKEKTAAFRAGALFGIVCLFALVGILSLFSSCTKCVQCTTTYTTTDLNDNPTGSTHESFPICKRNEKKYWDGRKTSESKGTYKLKSYTTCQ